MEMNEALKAKIIDKYGDELFETIENILQDKFDNLRSGYVLEVLETEILGIAPTETQPEKHIFVSTLHEQDDPRYQLENILKTKLEEHFKDYQSLSNPTLKGLMAWLLDGSQESLRKLKELASQFEAEREAEKAKAEARAKKAEAKAAKATAEAKAVKAKLAEVDKPKMGQVDGTKRYHFVQRTISKGADNFEVDNDYASSNLTALVKRETFLVVNPQNDVDISSEYVTSMLNQMNDETADFLDILCDKWLSSNPKHENHYTMIHVDELLDARGLQRHKAGNGRRGGHNRKERDDAKAHLKALSSLEIKGKYHSYKHKKEMEYTSRVVNITDTIEDGDCFMIIPGQIFAMNLLGLNGSKQVAKIPLLKIAQYDPRMQYWEKRIGRYFVWLWRAGQRNKKTEMIVKVKTLLDAVGEEKNKPAQTRDALEKALEKLTDDGIIGQWHYVEDPDETLMKSGKSWMPIYKEYNIEVKTPQAIIESYAQIEPKTPRRRHKAKPKTLTLTEKSNGVFSTDSQQSGIAEHIKSIIHQEKLTTRQAADEINIGKSSLNRYINGVEPVGKTRKKIEDWLSKKQALSH